MKLYTYWRSQASYRVRIALRLKGLPAEMASLDLLKGDQFDAAYRALNPEMVVPTLLDGDGPPLVQSLAILEYLEEKHPQPPLLPADLRARAHVRGLAQMVAMDAHPFIVPRVRKYLEQELHLDEPARMKWLRHWLEAGSRAIEDALARNLDVAAVHGVENVVQIARVEVIIVSFSVPLQIIQKMADLMGLGLDHEGTRASRP